MRYLVLALLVAVAALTIACGDDNDDAGDGASSPAATQPADTDDSGGDAASSPTATQPTDIGDDGEDGDEGGDDDGQVLELRGFTISERDYETHLAKTLAENPVGFAFSCSIFEGLDADQVATMLYSDEDEENFPATATIVPGQEGNPDDMQIAAEMVLERCQFFED